MLTKDRFCYELGGALWIMKNYIAIGDKIGYISFICDCEECKERKIKELVIHDLDGNHLECIKVELNKMPETLYYVGHSLSDAVKTLTEEFKTEINRRDRYIKMLNSLCDYLGKFSED